METAARIHLNPKKIRSVERYHPWIFSGAIRRIEGKPSDGDFVTVCGANDAIIGHGFYAEGASIAVRLSHFGSSIPAENWWQERLQNAWNYRKNLGINAKEDTNAFRWIHGEGDGLPGLILDCYNGVVVMQAHHAGIYSIRHELAESIKAVYGPELKAIYCKSRETMHDDGLEDEYLFGSLEGRHSAKENGLSFFIDFEGGQKTGFFIDQRENRALLANYASGKKVLNTFSYTAGFSVYALQADAALVHSLDSSQRALDFGDENVKLNGAHTDRHRSIKADAVDYLKHLDESYDIIVLDPPAFAKHQRAKHRAVQAYKRINRLAMEQITKGGLLFTFSCSQAIDEALFANTVTAAAIEAGRHVRIVHRLHQPADHPVNAFHSEGAYLKGLVLEVGASIT